jgi:hypothetical protein
MVSAASVFWSMPANIRPLFLCRPIANEIGTSSSRAVLPPLPKGYQAPDSDPGATPTRNALALRPVNLPKNITPPNRGYEWSD